MTGVDHVTVAVPDLGEAWRLVTSRSDVSIGAAKEVPTQDVCIAYAELRNIKLDLVTPISAASRTTVFLENRPLGGLHHINLNVTDAKDAHAIATAQDIATVGPPHPGHHGRELIILGPKETPGALVEIENGE